MNVRSYVHKVLRRLVAIGEDILTSAACCVLTRSFLAIAGGYLLAAGLSALAAAALARVLPPSEAVVLMAMLAFLIYLALLIWAFAERRLLRVLLVLGVGGSLAFAAQWLVGTAA